jgi:hypothetical protein
MNCSRTYRAEESVRLIFGQALVERPGRVAVTDQKYLSEILPQIASVLAQISVVCRDNTLIFSEVSAVLLNVSATCPVAQVLPEILPVLVAIAAVITKVAKIVVNVCAVAPDTAGDTLEPGRFVHIERIKEPEGNEKLSSSSGYGLRYRFILTSSFGQHETVTSLRYLQ